VEENVLVSGGLVDSFESDGFVVLRGAFDPSALAEEFDTVRRDAFGDDQEAQTLEQGSGTVTFLYVPMMCERTPVSVALIERCAVHAAELVSRPVLPGRAKGTWYEGDTGWHRDSALDLVSVGVVAYLEPLAATTGALRVLPGSHVHADDPLPERAATVGEAIGSEPGDVIIFDEHLIHGSAGGLLRRQWRVDFVVDPRNGSELAAADAWFGQSIPDERHETAYDAERYPSYGPHWQALDLPWTSRLRELGVYDRANGRAS
jgi:Phytanoyl-CoA dioxygenase (PhyH)